MENNKLNIYKNEQEDSNLVKSLKYFVNRLNSYIESDLKEADYIETRDVESFITNLSNDISNYIDMLNYKLLFYKSELIDIINDLKEEILKNDTQRRKPIPIDKKPYYERATSRLMLLFRKQMISSKEEFLSKYNENFSYLKTEFDTFWELIDWLQQNNISVLPDRIMICAYLGITIETYNDILHFCNNKQIKNIFQMFEENIISGKLNASEIGTRNNNAVKTNVSYDKVGNSLSPKDSTPKIITNNLNISNEEILEKMRMAGYRGLNNSNDSDQSSSDKNVLDYTN